MVLTTIINAVLKLRYCVKRWKNVNVIIIQKLKKNPMFSKNYKPRLSTTSKAAEKVIATKLGETT